MKNIFKMVSIFMLMLSGFAFGQGFQNSNYQELKDEISSDRRVKLYCVEYSCCGIGPFSEEVWSHTNCVYYTSTKKTVVVSHLNIPNGENVIKDIEIKQDVLIADKDGSLQKQGLEAVMPAGKYFVFENEIIFEPRIQKSKIRVHCLTSENEGSFFGHHYHYNVTICISFGFDKFNEKGQLDGGYAVIDFSNSKEILDLAAANDNILKIDNNLIFERKYILPAGTYIIDEGKVYTRNLLLAE